MSQTVKNAIEIQAQFSIHANHLDEFKSAARECIQRVRDHEPGALRYDYFLDEERMRAFAVDVYTDEAALEQHFVNQRKTFPALLTHASPVLRFIGHPGDTALQTAAPLRPAVFEFFGGLEEQSAAGRFSSRDEAPEAERGNHIEIISEFKVFDGKWERFCELAREHIDVVREKDPGTLRYDWFLDESRQACLALDSYRDSEGMFAHMKNCRHIHHEFDELAKMSTCFLGELPEAAARAVANYQPEIWPFFEGIKAYSAGGFK